MEQGKLRFLAAIAVMGVLIVGCATTCEKMTVKYQDHPDLPEPAKTVIFQCGEKKVKWNVGEAPPASCMKECFARPPE